MIEEQQVEEIDQVDQENNDDEKVEQENLTLIHKKFDGVAAGFSFWLVQMKSVQAAVEKYGEKVVLKLINRALSSGTRIEAKSKLPKYEKPKDQEEAWAKLITEQKTELLTQEQALAYIPGQRELSVEGVMRLAIKARKEGDNNTYRKLLFKAQQMIAELSDDEEDSDEE